MHRILKYGKDLFLIIEPTRQSILRKKDGYNMLTFKSREDALEYCKENKLEVSPEYETI